MAVRRVKTKRAPKADDYDEEFEDDDEEEFEEPASRSNGSKKRKVRDDDDDDDDEEEEEKPRRAKRRSRDDDDDDEEEEEAPKKKRRPARDEDDDDEEEERPKKRRRARDDEDDDDDDEETKLQGGWSAYKRDKAETSSFANSLELGEDPVLVKFLDDEPVLSYQQHWVERNGKKSFICLGNTCPLCDVGDKKSAKTVFNVAHLDDDGKVTVRALFGGVLLTDGIATKVKKLPATSGYWSISRTGAGKKGRTNFFTERVKERDLAEDWDAEPIDEKKLRKLMAQRYRAEDLVQRQTRKELLEVAREFTGDTGDDD